VDFKSVFEGLARESLTVEEAAKLLGFEPQEFQRRIGIWGARIDDLFKIFDMIQNDEISRSEAAITLGVGVREVNHLMQSWGVRRPLKEYLVRKAEVSVKWELHKKWAIGFIADEYSIEEAALGANLSTRQMRRWIAELLNKHYEMVYKDLKELSLARRRRLADEMETAEGIELSKRKVLESISRGERSLEQEALERVLSKRSVERRKHVRRITDKKDR
jgi:hypothetical protein